MSEKENPQTEDVIVIRIAYDMKTNALTMNAKCPTTMMLGILETAKMFVFRNQVLETLKMEAERSRIVPATTLPCGGAA